MGMTRAGSPWRKKRYTRVSWVFELTGTHSVIPWTSPRRRMSGQSILLSTGAKCWGRGLYSSPPPGPLVNNV